LGSDGISERITRITIEIGRGGSNLEIESGIVEIGVGKIIVDSDNSIVTGINSPEGLGCWIQSDVLDSRAGEVFGSEGDVGTISASGSEVGSNLEVGVDVVGYGLSEIQRINPSKNSHIEVVRNEEGGR